MHTQGLAQGGLALALSVDTCRLHPHSPVGATLALAVLSMHRVLGSYSKHTSGSGTPVVIILSASQQTLARPLPCAKACIWTSVSQQPERHTPNFLPAYPLAGGLMWIQQ